MKKRYPCSIAAIAAALMIGGVTAEEQHEKHSHRFANDIDAFHSALVPLWHARAGKERSEKVCANAIQLERLAREIRSADPKSLLASIAALRTRCQEKPADIDAAFSQVHDAFHRLIEPGRH